MGRAGAFGMGACAEFLASRRSKATRDAYRSALYRVVEDVNASHGFGRVRQEGGRTESRRIGDYGQVENRAVPPPQENKAAIAILGQDFEYDSSASLFFETSERRLE